MPGEVAPARRTFFHPLSGAVILGVDWLAFGLDVFSGFASLLLAGLAAFAVTFYGVFRIQLREGDPPRLAAAKAFFGALAAGVPFPVAGTVVGGLILALSGLPSIYRRRP